MALRIHNIEQGILQAHIDTNANQTQPCCVDAVGVERTLDRDAPHSASKQSNRSYNMYNWELLFKCILCFNNQIINLFSTGYTRKSYNKIRMPFWDRKQQKH